MWYTLFKKGDHDPFLTWALCTLLHKSNCKHCMWHAQDVCWDLCTTCSCVKELWPEHLLTSLLHCSTGNWNTSNRWTAMVWRNWHYNFYHTFGEDVFNVYNLACKYLHTCGGSNRTKLTPLIIERHGIYHAPWQVKCLHWATSIELATDCHDHVHTW